jgi:hypothetical protein
MTKSPIIVGLTRRFRRSRNSVDEIGYRRFTTTFDEVVDATKLASLLSKLPPEQRRSFEEANQRFDTLFSAERVQIAANGAALVRDLQHKLPVVERGRTIVSFADR